MFTTKPRERFTKCAPSFIWEISFSPKKFLLEELSSTCKVTTSDTANNSDNSSILVAFPNANLSSTS